MEEIWAERTGGSQEGAVKWSFQETQGTQWKEWGVSLVGGGGAEVVG